MKDNEISLESLRETYIDEAPDHWLINEDDLLEYEGDEPIELLQTGSVTTEIAGKLYVVSLVITPLNE